MIMGTYGLSNLKFFFTMGVGIFAFGLSSALCAESDSDDSGKDPVAKVQEMMRNPKERQKAMENSPLGPLLQEQISSIAGGSSETTDAIFGLAADIFGNFAKDGEIDMPKMLEMMKAVQENPESFTSQLTAAQKEKLNQIKIAPLTVPSQITNSQNASPTSGGGSTIGQSNSAPPQTGQRFGQGGQAGLELTQTGASSGTTSSPTGLQPGLSLPSRLR